MIHLAHVLIRRLLIRPGAIGDFIVSLPALESLRADFTEVWCAEQNVPLARFADAAQSLVAAGLNRLGLLVADDVIERLRGFDSIISWYGAGNPEFRALVADLKLPFQFVPALPDGNAQAVDFYNAQARSLGAAPASRYPRLHCSDQLCPTGLRIFAAIHPFASSPAKRAPLPIFEAAARILAETMPVYWLCGAEETLPGAVRIENLYELACWLAQARVFVGNDSGISHLAAAVGTPVRALFRVTAPAIWAPRGSCVDAGYCSDGGYSFGSE
ncbi:MAG: glycosyltransferase family 9 protein [Acidobacteriota bacterium]|nr:glycosyltransferase family 9 protein [Acidobacteriota bacterium]